MSEAKPLVKRLDVSALDDDYYYDRVHSVCIRKDYNPRTDYADELGKAIRRLEAKECG